MFQEGLEVFEFTLRPWRPSWALLGVLLGCTRGLRGPSSAASESRKRDPHGNKERSKRASRVPQEDGVRIRRMTIRMRTLRRLRIRRAVRTPKGSTVRRKPEIQDCGWRSSGSIFRHCQRFFHVFPAARFCRISFVAGLAAPVARARSSVL